MYCQIGLAEMSSGLSTTLLRWRVCARAPALLLSWTPVLQDAICSSHASAREHGGNMLNPTATGRTALPGCWRQIRGLSAMAYRCTASACPCGRGTHQLPGSSRWPLGSNGGASRSERRWGSVGYGTYMRICTLCHTLLTACGAHWGPTLVRHRTVGPRAPTRPQHMDLCVLYVASPCCGSPFGDRRESQGKPKDLHPIPGDCPRSPNLFMSSVFVGQVSSLCKSLL